MLRISLVGRQVVRAVVVGAELASPRFHQNLRENASLIYEGELNPQFAQTSAQTNAVCAETKTVKLKQFEQNSAQTKIVCAELSDNFSANNFPRMNGRAGAQWVSWHVFFIK
jgi:hypothetical protein